MRLLVRFMGFLFAAGTVVFLVGVAAVAGALNYRLAVAPRKKPNRGEQGALDLIARMRSAPADLQ